MTAVPSIMKQMRPNSIKIAESETLSNSLIFQCSQHHSEQFEMGSELLGKFLGVVPRFHLKALRRQGIHFHHQANLTQRILELTKYKHYKNYDETSHTGIVLNHK